MYSVYSLLPKEQKSEGQYPEIMVGEGFFGASNYYKSNLSFWQYGRLHRQYAASASFDPVSSPKDELPEQRLLVLINE
jgi:hypothetical protein